MQKITSLLSRFSLFVPLGSVVATTVSEEVFNALGITIPPGKIRYTQGCVYLGTEGGTRAALILQKAEIINRVNVRLQKHNVTISDIR